jgi:hypothetical protein
LLVTLALGLSASGLRAETTQTTPVSATRLEQLSWLAGSWRGDTGRSRQEEHWTSPAGGLMLGLHRDLGPSGRASFEYLRIEQRADGLVYLASPGGREPTPFRLVEISSARAVFENPDHDFPKRIVYSREGEVLTARAEGDGGNGMQWRWNRASLMEP